MSIIAIILGIITLGLMIAAFWYYLKSVVVMAKRNALLGVAGFFFAPIAQIVYYLAEKNNLSIADRKILLRSIWIWVVITMLGILAAILLPALQPTT